MKNKSPLITRRTIAALIIAGFGLTLISIRTNSSEITDKNHQSMRIKFSHPFHIKEAGVACIDCHTAAAGSVQASDNLFAKMEVCQSCHEDQRKSQCTFCHENSDSTTYAAIPNPKRTIIFSHKFHVEDQKVECETCHKNMDNADGSYGTLVPSMETCSGCHNDVKAPAACEKCHTDFASLRPKDHNRSDFKHEHKQAARVDNATCGLCHTQESCAECHDGGEIMKVNVPGTDLTVPHAPRFTANDRGQGLRLQKVHDLNFRYTHGIEAKGKTTECQTCHSDETFCTTCHMAGGFGTKTAFQPKSHAAADFIIPGVGSGGGQHAKLAKRDIESCAACHDPEGTDPVCITCHKDPDGIKGTNYKTHDPGFMATTHGYWHDDPGASCYMCHTDINAHPRGIKGQKFCGYCHR